jgi:hypothetical protein
MTRASAPVTSARHARCRGGCARRCASLRIVSRSTRGRRASRKAETHRVRLLAFANERKRRQCDHAFDAQAWRERAVKRCPDLLYRTRAALRIISLRAQRPLPGPRYTRSTRTSSPAISFRLRPRWDKKESNAAASSALKPVTPSESSQATSIQSSTPSDWHRDTEGVQLSAHPTRRRRAPTRRARRPAIRADPALWLPGREGSGWVSAATRALGRNRCLSVSAGHRLCRPGPAGHVLGRRAAL